jgi:aspartate kinase
MEAAHEIVVQKYGGSSVADPEKLGQVAERVAATVRAGKRVVVVVSAMGKTTDELIALATRISPAPPRRELDMLLSAGERISMALLAMALEQRGVEAISFTGSQSGILTNDRHSGARIIEVRPVRIQDELERGKVVIVAGFQGMSYKREITTLGRGGTDTTAVAVAAALGAAYCEICSDVDGVYTADPRVVPEARRIEALSYEAMQELAEHGAKVLNAQAVEWARKAGIVLYARATAGRPDRGPVAETRIGALDGGREQRGAVAVTGTKRLVRLRAPRPQDLRPLLAALAEQGVALRSLAVDGTLEASFARDDLPDWPRVERALAASCTCAVDEIGAVTLVGPGVGSDPRALGRAFEAAEQAGARLATCRATPLSLTLQVDPESVDPATRALHGLIA